jgi:hypothetical protein
LVNLSLIAGCGLQDWRTSRRKMMKSLAIAAFAAFASLAAPATVQAAETLSPEAPVILAGGGYYERDPGFGIHRPRHPGKGFSLEFQFGHPNVIHVPRYPNVIHVPRHPRPVIHLTRNHVQWCYNRYRTYDHRSNSFVIRHGQRAYCVSPFSY